VQRLYVPDRIKTRFDGPALHVVCQVRRAKQPRSL
jgi:hypothetical protein